ncbi:uncharacterized protein [Mytilus edulis]|uniref:uncharacterized protein n=1 Tax=Mytilus edulis TaxID=6550 RepID=UPI0039F13803
MSKTVKERSLEIYHNLCDIIGSEEVVKTRRNIFCALDGVYRVPLLTVISSGSKAEGLDLNGSDYDQMVVDKWFCVYEDLSKVSLYTNKRSIIMNTHDTKPGFTKLRLFNQRLICVPYINQIVEVVEGEAYISSKSFREYNLSDDMIIHGPCASSPNDMLDSVSCLQCREWIKPAHRWIFRSRSPWPDHRLVMSVVKEGVLFVPIGCRGSANEDLEWRISFSMAEKQLIFSFSHTQLLCYALLKIILKDIIKSKHGDLICSYFLKTIMFWLCEESSPSEWHPGKIISCIMICFRRLIYCVEYKTCLHYFIPENNLFEGRFTDNQHNGLLNTLHDLYNSFWDNVNCTNTFQRFREEQRMSYFPYLTASSLSCLPYTSSVVTFTCFINMKQTITCLIDNNHNEISAYMLALISNQWIQSPYHAYANNFKRRNKSVYKQYQVHFNCLNTGIYSDVNTAWSLLASFFYKHDRFHECIYIVNYCLSKCTPDKIMLRLHNRFCEQTYFQRVKKAVGIILACKYLIVDMVLFKKPYHLFPVELFHIIPQDVRKDIFRIPAVVYLNMLSFLCLYHLGDDRGKLNALRDLELTIRKKYFIFPCNLYYQIANKCLRIAKSMM